MRRRGNLFVYEITSSLQQTAQDKKGVKYKLVGMAALVLTLTEEKEYATRTTLLAYEE